VKKRYHTIDRQGKANERKLADHLTRNGQAIMPMVDLIEQCRMAVDRIIDVAGRSVIQAVLELSAERVVGGPRQQGRARPGEVVWHGHQAGSVKLSDRTLRVSKPRLRRKGEDGGEVAVPAYEAMQDDEGLGRQVLGVLMKGVSTRQYAEVIPEMAETLGVSRSNVSREMVAASEAELQKLVERPLGELKLLVIYLDGMSFGDHMLISAVGVDEEGHKHVLGLAEGATENAAAVQDLLESMVARGVDPSRKLLLVIDGAKAMRTAINRVFGAQHPIQRCRTHKLRNVLERLPQDQRDQVAAAMKAAWKLEAKEGIAKLKKLSEWLDQWPAAAASLLEGLEECFTVNHLGMPASLHRCLTTTNIIESPHSGVRMRTRRVCRWRDGRMVLRWGAASWLATEKNFRRLMGYKDLWMLKATLRESEQFPLPKREVA
jgi:transposase-like protein